MTNEESLLLIERSIHQTAATYGLTIPQAEEHYRLMASPLAAWREALRAYMNTTGPYFNGDHIASGVASWLIASATSAA